MIECSVKNFQIHLMSTIWSFINQLLEKIFLLAIDCQ